nr:unnamed protein product [Callosobruchus analis]CAI5861540.1 unnamed protein product [Callosobruchus analis]
MLFLSTFLERTLCNDNTSADSDPAQRRKEIEANSSEDDDLETAYRTYLPLFAYRKRQAQRTNRGR